VRAWLRRGAAAASLAGERSDLWPAASLAWLAYGGWLPLLLAVAPPRVQDVADLAVKLASSGSFPLNVIALSAAAVTGLMLLCLLAGLGEVAVLRSLRAGAAAGEATNGREQPALMALAVVLVASLPVLAAAAWLAVSAAEVGPAVYGEPGPAATVPARLAGRLIPQLALLGVVVFAAQVIGGLALRHVLLRPRGGPALAIVAALRRAVRRPLPWLGVAAAGWVKDALLLLIMLTLLPVLWGPIGESLGPGLPGSPQALVLLVGFVAIWLSLLLVGGALHAFISAWWLAEWRSTEDG
jgi:hypothetical protein